MLQPPDDDGLGPSRAGSFREDAVYSNFYLSLDLIDWNEQLDQNFGFLARMAQPGTGCASDDSVLNYLE